MLAMTMPVPAVVVIFTKTVTVTRMQMEVDMHAASPRRIRQKAVGSPPCHLLPAKGQRQTLQCQRAVKVDHAVLINHSCMLPRRC